MYVYAYILVNRIAYYNGYIYTKHIIIIPHKYCELEAQYLATIAESNGKARAISGIDFLHGANVQLVAVSPISTFTFFTLAILPVP